MSTSSHLLICKLLKRINEETIERIAEKFGLNPEEMKKKYHTPNLYTPAVMADTVKVVFKDYRFD